MIAVALEEVVRTYCDVCGNDVSNSNRIRYYGLDFCMERRSEIMGRHVSCEELYKIKMQIESADLDF